MNKKNVIFIISSLSGGGAEKIMLSLMENMPPVNYDITLVMFEKKGALLEQIPKHVKPVFLDKRCRLDFIRMVFKLVFQIYPKIKPETTVSFMEYPNFVNIIAGKLYPGKLRIIVSQRNNPDYNHRLASFQNLKKKMIRWLYPKANTVIVISRGLKTILNEIYGIKNEIIKVIYNAIPVEEILKKSKEHRQFLKGFHKNRNTLITCARLEPQKNIRFLLNIFAEIHKEINGQLVVIGKGSQEQELKTLAQELNIQHRVFFPGFVDNPYNYIREADIFVLPSLWEGFGNVILESMVCGTAVISSDCPYGPSEIIESGKNGILVPTGDYRALKEAILYLLHNKKERSRIEEQALASLEKFSFDKMIMDYLNIL